MYKYPCIVCGSPCCLNIHDSISCVICDEWVHLKCTDLTDEQFLTYTSPDHENDPYYCVKCLYGNESSRNRETGTNPLLNTNSSFLVKDIFNYCSNSIFNNNDDITLSDYYTVDELNTCKSSPNQDLFLLHIDAVSLTANYDNIVDTIGQLKQLPSLLFISETKLHDSKIDDQLAQISIDGYSIAFTNSSTKAGDTAIYINNSLSFTERTDIKFVHPD